ncbi:hypothetical protein ACIA8K_03730 [Catenuloplanes sp. NPDC051500]|uniref:hypothetical protein n=1 Tax=Catenuloplanes sp. NPDC051500 TaxID=3363959 RepID=UPI0037AD8C99
MGDGSTGPDPANIEALATQWRLFGDQIGMLEGTVNRIIEADFAQASEYPGYDFNPMNEIPLFPFPGVTWTGDAFVEVNRTGEAINIRVKEVRQACRSMADSLDEMAAELRKAQKQKEGQELLDLIMTILTGVGMALMLVMLPLMAVTLPARLAMLFAGLGRVLSIVGEMVANIISKIPMISSSVAQYIGVFVNGAFWAAAVDLSIQAAVNTTHSMPFKPDPAGTVFNILLGGALELAFFKAFNAHGLSGPGGKFKSGFDPKSLGPEQITGNNQDVTGLIYNAGNVGGNRGLNGGVVPEAPPMTGNHIPSNTPNNNPIVAGTVDTRGVSNIRPPANVEASSAPPLRPEVVANSGQNSIAPSVGATPPPSRRPSMENVRTTDSSLSNGGGTLGVKRPPSSSAQVDLNNGSNVSLPGPSRQSGITPVDPLQTPPLRLDGKAPEAALGQRPPSIEASNQLHTPSNLPGNLGSTGGPPQRPIETGDITQRPASGEFGTSNQVPLKPVVQSPNGQFVGGGGEHVVAPPSRAPSVNGPGDVVMRPPGSIGGQLDAPGPHQALAPPANTSRTPSAADLPDGTSVPLQPTTAKPNVHAITDNPADAISSTPIAPESPRGRTAGMPDTPTVSRAPSPEGLRSHESLHTQPDISRPGTPVTDAFRSPEGMRTPESMRPAPDTARPGSLGGEAFRSPESFRTPDGPRTAPDAPRTGADSATALPPARKPQAGSDPSVVDAASVHRRPSVESFESSRLPADTSNVSSPPMQPVDKLPTTSAAAGGEVSALQRPPTPPTRPSSASAPESLYRPTQGFESPSTRFDGGSGQPPRGRDGDGFDDAASIGGRSIGGFDEYPSIMRSTRDVGADDVSSLSGRSIAGENDTVSSLASSSRTGIDDHFEVPVINRGLEASTRHPDVGSMSSSRADSPVPTRPGTSAGDPPTGSQTPTPARGITGNTPDEIAQSARTFVRDEFAAVKAQQPSTTWLSEKGMQRVQADVARDAQLAGAGAGRRPMEDVEASVGRRIQTEMNFERQHFLAGKKPDVAVDSYIKANPGLESSKTAIRSSVAEDLRVAVNEAGPNATRKQLTTIRQQWEGSLPQRVTELGDLAKITGTFDSLAARAATGDAPPTNSETVRSSFEAGVRSDLADWRAASGGQSPMSRGDLSQRIDARVQSAQRDLDQAAAVDKTVANEASWAGAQKINGADGTQISPTSLQRAANDHADAVRAAHSSARGDDASFNAQRQTLRDGFTARAQREQDIETAFTREFGPQLDARLTELGGDPATVGGRNARIRGEAFNRFRDGETTAPLGDRADGNTGLGGYRKGFDDYVDMHVNGRVTNGDDVPLTARDATRADLSTRAESIHNGAWEEAGPYARSADVHRVTTQRLAAEDGGRAAAALERTGAIEGVVRKGLVADLDQFGPNAGKLQLRPGEAAQARNNTIRQLESDFKAIWGKDPTQIHRAPETTGGKHEQWQQKLDDAAAVYAESAYTARLNRLGADVGEIKVRPADKKPGRAEPFKLPGNAGELARRMDKAQTQNRQDLVNRARFEQELRLRGNDPDAAIARSYRQWSDANPELAARLRPEDAAVIRGDWEGEVQTFRQETWGRRGEGVTSPADAGNMINKRATAFQARWSEAAANPRQAEPPAAMPKDWPGSEASWRESQRIRDPKARDAAQKMFQEVSARYAGERGPDKRVLAAEHFDQAGVEFFRTVRTVNETPQTSTTTPPAGGRPGASQAAAKPQTVRERLVEARERLDDDLSLSQVADHSFHKAMSEKNRSVLADRHLDATQRARLEKSWHGAVRQLRVELWDSKGTGLFTRRHTEPQMQGRVWAKQLKALAGDLSYRITLEGKVNGLPAAAAGEFATIMGTRGNRTHDVLSPETYDALADRFRSDWVSARRELGGSREFENQAWLAHERANENGFGTRLDALDAQFTPAPTPNGVFRADTGGDLVPAGVVPLGRSDTHLVPADFPGLHARPDAETLPSQLKGEAQPLPRPEPLSPERMAEFEAKVQELHASLQPKAGTAKAVEGLRGDPHKIFDDVLGSSSGKARAANLGDDSRFRFVHDLPQAEQAGWRNRFVREHHAEFEETFAPLVRNGTTVDTPAWNKAVDSWNQKSADLQARLKLDAFQHNEIGRHHAAAERAVQEARANGVADTDIALGMNAFTRDVQMSVDSVMNRRFTNGDAFHPANRGAWDEMDAGLGGRLRDYLQRSPDVAGRMRNLLDQRVDGQLGKWNSALGDDALTANQVAKQAGDVRSSIADDVNMRVVESMLRQRQGIGSANGTRSVGDDLDSVVGQAVADRMRPFGEVYNGSSPRRQLDYQTYREQRTSGLMDDLARTVQQPGVRLNSADVTRLATEVRERMGAVGEEVRPGLEQSGYSPESVRSATDRLDAEAQQILQEMPARVRFEERLSESLRTADFSYGEFLGPDGPRANRTLGQEFGKEWFTRFDEAFGGEHAGLRGPLSKETIADLAGAVKAPDVSNPLFLRESGDDLVPVGTSPLGRDAPHLVPENYPGLATRPGPDLAPSRATGTARPLPGRDESAPSAEQIADFEARITRLDEAFTARTGTAKNIETLRAKPGEIFDEVLSAGRVHAETVFGRNETKAAPTGPSNRTDRFREIEAELFGTDAPRPGRTLDGSTPKAEGPRFRFLHDLPQAELSAWRSRFTQEYHAKMEETFAPVLRDGAAVDSLSWKNAEATWARASADMKAQLKLDAFHRNEIGRHRDTVDQAVRTARENGVSDADIALGVRAFTRDVQMTSDSLVSGGYAGRDGFGRGDAFDPAHRPAWDAADAGLGDRLRTYLQRTPELAAEMKTRIDRRVGGQLDRWNEGLGTVALSPEQVAKKTADLRASIADEVDTRVVESVLTHRDGLGSPDGLRSIRDDLDASVDQAVAGRVRQFGEIYNGPAPRRQVDVESHRDTLVDSLHADLVQTVRRPGVRLSSADTSRLAAEIRGRLDDLHDAARPGLQRDGWSAESVQAAKTRLTAEADAIRAEMGARVRFEEKLSASVRTAGDWYGGRLGPDGPRSNRALSQEYGREWFTHFDAAFGGENAGLRGPLPDRTVADLADGVRAPELHTAFVRESAGDLVPVGTSPLGRDGTHLVPENFPGLSKPAKTGPDEPSTAPGEQPRGTAHPLPKRRLDTIHRDVEFGDRTEQLDASFQSKVDTAKEIEKLRPDADRTFDEVLNDGRVQSQELFGTSGSNTGRSGLDAMFVGDESRFRFLHNVPASEQMAWRSRFSDQLHSKFEESFAPVLRDNAAVDSITWKNAEASWQRSLGEMRAELRYDAFHRNEVDRFRNNVTFEVHRAKTELKLSEADIDLGVRAFVRDVQISTNSVISGRFGGRDGFGRGDAFDPAHRSTWDASDAGLRQRLRDYLNAAPGLSRDLNVTLHRRTEVAVSRWNDAVGEELFSSSRAGKTARDLRTSMTEDLKTRLVESMLWHRERLGLADGLRTARNEFLADANTFVTERLRVVGAAYDGPAPRRQAGFENRRDELVESLVHDLVLTSRQAGVTVSPEGISRMAAEIHDRISVLTDDLRPTMRHDQFSAESVRSATDRLEAEVLSIRSEMGTRVRLEELMSSSLSHAGRRFSDLLGRGGPIANRALSREYGTAWFSHFDEVYGGNVSLRQPLPDRTVDDFAGRLHDAAVDQHTRFRGAAEPAGRDVVRAVLESRLNRLSPVEAPDSPSAQAVRRSVLDEFDKRFPQGADLRSADRATWELTYSDAELRGMFDAAAHRDAFSTTLQSRVDEQLDAMIADRTWTDGTRASADSWRSEFHTMVRNEFDTTFPANGTARGSSDGRFDTAAAERWAADLRNVVDTWYTVKLTQTRAGETIDAVVPDPAVAAHVKAKLNDALSSRLSFGPARDLPQLGRPDQHGRVVTSLVDDLEPTVGSWLKSAPEQGSIRPDLTATLARRLDEVAVPTPNKPDYESEMAAWQTRWDREAAPLLEGKGNSKPATDSAELIRDAVMKDLDGRLTGSGRFDRASWEKSFTAGLGVLRKRLDSVTPLRTGEDGSTATEFGGAMYRAQELAEFDVRWDMATNPILDRFGTTGNARTAAKDFAETVRGRMKADLDQRLRGENGEFDRAVWDETVTISVTSFEKQVGPVVNRAMEQDGVGTAMFRAEELLKFDARWDAEVAPVLDRYGPSGADRAAAAHFSESSRGRLKTELDQQLRGENGGFDRDRWDTSFTGGVETFRRDVRGVVDREVYSGEYGGGMFRAEELVRFDARWDAEIAPVLDRYGTSGSGRAAAQELADGFHARMKADLDQQLRGEFDRDVWDARFTGGLDSFKKSVGGAVDRATEAPGTVTPRPTAPGTTRPLGTETPSVSTRPGTEFTRPGSGTRAGDDPSTAPLPNRNGTETFTLERPMSRQPDTRVLERLEHSTARNAARHDLQAALERRTPEEMRGSEAAEAVHREVLADFDYQFPPGGTFGQTERVSYQMWEAVQGDGALQAHFTAAADRARFAETLTTRADRHVEAVMNGRTWTDATWAAARSVRAEFRAAVQREFDEAFPADGSLPGRPDHLFTSAEGRRWADNLRETADNWFTIRTMQLRAERVIDETITDAGLAGHVRGRLAEDLTPAAVFDRAGQLPSLGAAEQTRLLMGDARGLDARVTDWLTSGTPGKSADPRLVRTLTDRLRQEAVAPVPAGTGRDADRAAYQARWEEAVNPIVDRYDAGPKFDAAWDAAEQLRVRVMEDLETALRGTSPVSREVFEGRFAGSIELLRTRVAEAADPAPGDLVTGGGRTPSGETTPTPGGTTPTPRPALDPAAAAQVRSEFLRKWNETADPLLSRYGTDGPEATYAAKRRDVVMKILDVKLKAADFDRAAGDAILDAHLGTLQQRLPQVTARAAERAALDERLRDTAPPDARDSNAARAVRDSVLHDFDAFFPLDGKTGLMVRMRFEAYQDEVHLRSLHVAAGNRERFASVLWTRLDENIEDVLATRPSTEMTRAAEDSLRTRFRELALEAFAREFPANGTVRGAWDHLFETPAGNRWAGHLRDTADSWFTADLTRRRAEQLIDETVTDPGLAGHLRSRLNDALTPHLTFDRVREMRPLGPAEQGDLLTRLLGDLDTRFAAWMRSGTPGGEIDAGLLNTLVQRLREDIAVPVPGHVGVEAEVARNATRWHEESSQILAGHEASEQALHAATVISTAMIADLRERMEKDQYDRVAWDEHFAARLDVLRRRVAGLPAIDPPTMPEDAPELDPDMGSSPPPDLTASEPPPAITPEPESGTPVLPDDLFVETPGTGTPGTTDPPGTTERVTRRTRPTRPVHHLHRSGNLSFLSPIGQPSPTAAHLPTPAQRRHHLTLAPGTATNAMLTAALADLPADDRVSLTVDLPADRAYTVQEVRGLTDGGLTTPGGDGRPVAIQGDTVLRVPSGQLTTRPAASPFVTPLDADGNVTFGANAVMFEFRATANAWATANQVTPYGLPVAPQSRRFDVGGGWIGEEQEGTVHVGPAAAGSPVSADAVLVNAQGDPVRERVTVSLPRGEQVPAEVQALITRITGGSGSVAYRRPAGEFPSLPDRRPGRMYAFTVRPDAPVSEFLTGAPAEFTAGLRTGWHLRSSGSRFYLTPARSTRVDALLQPPTGGRRNVVVAEDSFDAAVVTELVSGLPAGMVADGLVVDLPAGTYSSARVQELADRVLRQRDGAPLEGDAVVRVSADDLEARPPASPFVIPRDASGNVTFGATAVTFEYRSSQSAWSKDRANRVTPHDLEPKPRSRRFQVGDDWVGEEHDGTLHFAPDDDMPVVQDVILVDRDGAPLNRRVRVSLPYGTETPPPAVQALITTINGGTPGFRRQVSELPPLPDRRARSVYAFNDSPDGTRSELLLGAPSRYTAGLRTGYQLRGSGNQFVLAAVGSVVRRPTTPPPADTEFHLVLPPEITDFSVVAELIAGLPESVRRRLVVDLPAGRTYTPAQAGDLADQVLVQRGAEDNWAALEGDVVVRVPESALEERASASRFVIPRDAQGGVTFGASATFVEFRPRKSAWSRDRANRATPHDLDFLEGRRFDTGDAWVAEERDGAVHFGPATDWPDSILVDADGNPVRERVRLSLPFGDRTPPAGVQALVDTVRGSSGVVAYRRPVADFPSLPDRPDDSLYAFTERPGETVSEFLAGASAEFTAGLRNGYQLRTSGGRLLLMPESGTAVLDGPLPDVREGTTSLVVSSDGFDPAVVAELVRGLSPEVRNRLVVDLRGSFTLSEVRAHAAAIFSDDDGTGGTGVVRVTRDQFEEVPPASPYVVPRDAQGNPTFGVFGTTFEIRSTRTAWARDPANNLRPHGLPVQPRSRLFNAGGWAVEESGGTLHLGPAGTSPVPGPDQVLVDPTGTRYGDRPLLSLPYPPGADLPDAVGDLLGRIGQSRGSRLTEFDTGFRAPASEVRPAPELDRLRQGLLPGYELLRRGRQLFLTRAGVPVPASPEPPVDDAYNLVVTAEVTQPWVITHLIAKLPRGIQRNLVVDLMYDREWTTAQAQDQADRLLIQDMTGGNPTPIEGAAVLRLPIHLFRTAPALSGTVIPVDTHGAPVFAGVAEYVHVRAAANTWARGRLGLPYGLPMRPGTRQLDIGEGWIAEESGRTAHLGPVASGSPLPGAQHEIVDRDGAPLTGEPLVTLPFETEGHVDSVADLLEKMAGSLGVATLPESSIGYRRVRTTAPAAPRTDDDSDDFDHFDHPDRSDHSDHSDHDSDWTDVGSEHSTEFEEARSQGDNPDGAREHGGAWDEPGSSGTFGDTPPSEQSPAQQPEPSGPPVRPAAAAGREPRLPRGVTAQNGVIVIGSGIDERFLHRIRAEHGALTADGREVPLVVVGHGDPTALERRLGDVLEAYYELGVRPVVVLGDRTGPDPFRHLFATYRVPAVQRSQSSGGGLDNLSRAWDVLLPGEQPRPATANDAKSALARAAADPVTGGYGDVLSDELHHWLGAGGWTLKRQLFSQHRDALASPAGRAAIERILSRRPARDIAAGHGQVKQLPAPVARGDQAGDASMSAHRAILEMAAADQADTAFNYLTETDPGRRAEILITPAIEGRVPLGTLADLANGANDDVTHGANAAVMEALRLTLDSAPGTGVPQAAQDLIRNNRMYFADKTDRVNWVRQVGRMSEAKRDRATELATFAQLVLTCMD